ncbi:hypothetical protein [Rhizobium rhizogenes]|uniref:hypothetical protein n=1 Tax=Rhizobium rhizogenes TaxID=359 RepID=UPI0024BDD6A0|nr:hypothetical protein [Rhizobium rhizogenes]MDJ1633204.1 hypothetical protein [Rhizobium rhizogenes]
MALLINDSQRAAALEFAAQHPAQGLDPGFSARFFADQDALLNAKNVNARDLQRADIQSDFIRRFYKESGIGVRNWLAGPQLSIIPDREAAARGQFEAWKKNNQDSDLFFPEAGYLDTESLRRSSSAISSVKTLQDNSTSWASSLGGFAGTAVGAMRDPLNAMTMAFGAGPAAGILRTAATEGALGAGAQALGTAVAYDYRKQVDPNFNFSTAAYEVAAAGVGGAVLGGGLKGLAGLWERLRTGDWPSHVVDAANVVQREAAVPSYRQDVTPQGKAVYRATVDKASDDLFAGRPVELPPEAFLQAQARPGRVYDADGRSVGVSYEVVDADSLTTSHANDMSVNPAFPQELQPRDRTRAISQDQVQSIAGNLQPERLGPSSDAANGAPIIGPDNLVESGNGRVMAIRRAYDMGGPSADSYRNYLQSQGYEIGDMAKPVLIARRVTDLSDEDRLNFVTAANRSTAMRLAPAEQALSDGRMIDEPLLDKLQGANVDATTNREFVRGFMQKLPRAEQSELVDRNGVLSQQGERRVMAALMGRAYGDPALLGRALEDADSNIKSIAGALGDAAAPWAKMRDAVSRGQIPRGMDITDDLLDAIRTVMKARDEGHQVRDLVNQGEMFGGPGETAKILARAIYGDANMTRAVSRKRLGAFLNDFATEAMKNDAGPRLFGEALQTGDVLRTSLAKAGREDLEAVAAERLAPEAIEKIAASPETEDAVIQSARKLIADNEERQLGPIGSAAEGPRREAEPIMIDLNDGRGERSLDEIMQEADDEIAAAKELESCAIGTLVF